MNMTTLPFNAEVVLYRYSCIRLLGGCVITRGDTLIFGRLFIISTFSTTHPSVPWFSRLLFPLRFVAGVIRPRTKLTLNELVWNPNELELLSWYSDQATVCNIVGRGKRFLSI